MWCDFCGREIQGTTDYPGMCQRCLESVIANTHTAKEDQMTPLQKKVLTNISRFAKRHNLDIVYYAGCVEPGYDDLPMLAANWNRPLTKLGEFIEGYFKAVLYVGWNDEWTMCDDCGKAARSAPNSYHWQPFWVEDTGVVCGACAKEDCLEGFINSVDCAIPSWLIPIAEHAGFICALDDAYLQNACKRFETGFYAGQNDTPEKALEELYELCDGKEVFENRYDYLFAITGRGQFDISWTILIKEK